MYEFTPEMGEISGMGGGYEAACRAMLKAGLDWWDTFPDSDPQYYGYKNVYGLIVKDNNDARDLDRAILSACNDCTGAMHHAVVNSILYIHTNGWDAYVKAMSKSKEKVK